MTFQDMSAPCDYIHTYTYLQYIKFHSNTSLHLTAALCHSAVDACHQCQQDTTYQETSARLMLPARMELQDTTNNCTKQHFCHHAS